jgi:hypothetical protein
VSAPGGGGQHCFTSGVPGPFQVPSKVDPSLFCCDHMGSRVLFMLCGGCGRACVCPADHIHRIVVTKDAAFRMCREEGMLRNPKSPGKVHF